MTSHCFGFEQNIRRHGDAQRQLAVELLRDATAADDAVQEVWLRARAHLAGDANRSVTLELGAGEYQDADVTLSK